MTQAFSYSHSFTLDKSHFEECYDQSVVPDTSPKRFLKAGIFVVIGIGLLFTEMTRYIAFFAVGLGLLEALSIHYKKPWWLMRQMMSKAAGNDVTLTVDELGLSTQSIYVTNQILWTDMYRIKESDEGFLITHKGGTSYTSKRCLDDAAIQFIQSKI